MNIITLAWWHLPLSRENKERLKSFIFVIFPIIFRNSMVYRNWKNARIFSKQYSIPLTPKPDGSLAEINPFLQSNLKFQPEPISSEPISSISIVIHAFHFDVFKEILKYLKNIQRVPFKIFVTSPSNITNKINTLLEYNSLEYHSISVENRGRDILPFLEMIPQVFNEGYQVILKIHTKKSNHRLTGELWRDDLYNKLLTNTAITQALRIFNKDHTVGLVGVPGHIVPMNLYYGANARRIEQLSEAMGVEISQLINLNFSAGSMFFIRKQALLPLVELNLTPGYFENESGQKDGTMAHAIERAFAVTTHAAKLKLVNITYDDQLQRLHITKDHPFTH